MPAWNPAEMPRLFDRLNERVRAIEAQLAVLSEKAGVPYEAASDGVPEEVVELARAGKQLEAVTRYRELTGADIEEAREVVGRL
jgi:ribosomal protein L7/L12